MKRTYDIAGLGEGLSGLLVCALLATKGFSCLWVDTSPQDHKEEKWRSFIPSLVTVPFWKHTLKPLLRSIDANIPDRINMRNINFIQSLIPGERLDINPVRLYEDFTHLRRCTNKYLALADQAFINPVGLFKESKKRAPEMEIWEEVLVSGLTRTSEINYMSYLRGMCGMQGFYSTDYRLFKKVLGESLSSAKGDYIKGHDASMIYHDNQVLSLKVDDINIKARYYLTEDLSSHEDKDEAGFLLYGNYILDSQVIPVGMGDLLFISPPEDLSFPLVLRVSRAQKYTHMSLMSKINMDGSLVSFSESLSWASEMILKRLKEVIPFMDDFFLGHETLSPFNENGIKQWFMFTKDIKVPSVFTRRRFARPLDKVFACDRMKCAWLDVEGELLWGSYLVNLILAHLNRSDLIIREQMR
ncbi:MAG: hypothetical protein J7L53_07255 [Deltaproteobacteria bacterium]|nr:hypothetical protein [Deltaproteobacteria bacterium]